MIVVVLTFIINLRVMYKGKVKVSVGDQLAGTTKASRHLTSGEHRLTFYGRYIVGVEIGFVYEGWFRGGTPAEWFIKHRLVIFLTKVDVVTGSLQNIGTFLLPTLSIRVFINGGEDYPTQDRKSKTIMDVELPESQK